MPDADETTGDLVSLEGQESLPVPGSADADAAGAPAQEDLSDHALEGSDDGSHERVAVAPEQSDVPADDADAQRELEEAPQQDEQSELGEAPQQDEEPESDEVLEQAATTGEEGASEDLGDPEPDATVDEAADEPVYELDPVLAASEDRAREALADITPADTIGPLVASLAQGEHVVSLQFANLMRGYPGWLWTATLSRIDETEDVNVLEVELLPGEGAVLAPDWVPWTDRLADYRAAQDAAGEELEDVDDDDEASDDEDADSEDEFDDQVVLDDDEDSDDDDSDDEDSDDEDSDDDDDDSDDEDSDDDDSDDDDSDDDDDDDDDDDEDDDDDDRDDDDR